MWLLWSQADWILLVILEEWINYSFEASIPSKGFLVVQIRDYLILLDAPQKLQWLWQGASISQIANWSEILVCFHF